MANIPFQFQIRDGLGDLVLSFVISLWIYVAVEAPVRQFAKSALRSVCEYNFVPFRLSI